MKRSLLLFLSIFILFFFITGCNNEVTVEDERTRLIQENNSLIEEKMEMEKEIVRYKDKLSELEKQLEKNKHAPISDDDIRKLLSNGQEQFFYVSSGGDIESHQTFEHNGYIYRFLGKDMENREELFTFLEKTFTTEIINEIIQYLNIIEHKGKLAQPDADRGSLLEWGKAIYKSIEMDGPVIMLNLEVPLGDTGQVEEKTIQIKYQKDLGWRIDSLVY